MTCRAAIRTLLVLAIGPVLGLFADAAIAGEGLEGRTVVFTATTWDDPAHPYLTSSGYVAVVAKGAEFTMTPEVSGNLFVVPVEIDIGDGRIELSYPGAQPGQFAEAAFNGYVLRFLVDCVLFEGARIEPHATTLPLPRSALTVEPRELRLNVSGATYDAASRVSIALDVTDCVIG